MPDRFPTPSFASIAGGRLRADRVCHRRRARLRPARAGARCARSRTLRFFANAPQGPRRERHDRLSRLLLSLPRHEDRRSASATSSCRRSTRRCCSPACCSRRSYFDRDTRDEARDPRARRRDLRPRRLDVGAEPRRRSSRMGWRPETGFLALRLARLQRGDAALHPGARLADAPGRPGRVERVD